MAQASESVAIYWDFVNPHANLVDRAHGRGDHLANRFRPQDEVIGPESDRRVRTLARADRNQPRFRQLGVLQSLQAVAAAGSDRADQVFPPGAKAKNGADIKPCLDVMVSSAEVTCHAKAP